MNKELESLTPDEEERIEALGSFWISLLPD